MKSEDAPSEMLNYAGAAKVLGLPRGTVYALVHDRKLPNHRLGKRLVRFSRKALLDWLADHVVQAKET